MNKEIKLLRPFTGTGCVFFPIGLPPKGTCEFATKECLKECYATQKKFPHYDIELAIPEEEKCTIYKYITERPIEWIIEKMVKELNGLQTSILHWFGSGDCLTKDVPRVSEIIEALLSSNITQMGFTRNVKLWRRHKDVFALTIENKRNLPEKSSGMFSIPDYREGAINIYSSDRDTMVADCGGYGNNVGNKRDKSLEHYMNCRACKSLHTGCFDRMEKAG